MDNDPLSPPPSVAPPVFTRLTAYQHCLIRLHATWPTFQTKRQERLTQ